MNTELDNISFSLESIIKTVFVFLLTLACLRVVMPFIGAIAWACIIAISVWPVFIYFRRKLWGRSMLASITVIFLLCLIIIVPIFLMGLGLFNTLPAISQSMGNLGHLNLQSPPNWLVNLPYAGEIIQSFWQSAQSDLPSMVDRIQPMLDEIFGWVFRQGMTMGKGFIEMLLALIIATVLLVSGDKLWNTFNKIVVKIGGVSHGDLPEMVAKTIRSVTTGVIGTAFVQALLMVIGLAITGVPGAMVLGFICFVIAVAQVPTILIWGPAAVWLFMNDQIVMMIVLIAWGGIPLNIADSFLRPYLIKQGSNMPLSLIFLGVIGGLFSFGPLGLFIGPTLLAVAYTLLLRWLAQNNIKDMSGNGDSQETDEESALKNNTPSEQNGKSCG